MFGRLLQPETIFGIKSIKSVWRPGSARASRGSLQLSPDPLAGFKGQGREDKEGIKEGQRKGTTPFHKFLHPPLRPAIG